MNFEKKIHQYLQKKFEKNIFKVNSKFLTTVVPLLFYPTTKLIKLFIKQ